MFFQLQPTLRTNVPSVTVTIKCWELSYNLRKTTTQ